uniref:TM2 domain-containing protein n=1 Tax=Parastrongyloides trichosuri TaxID=131310 RepID=A0A0N4ZKU9_PARTI
MKKVNRLVVISFFVFLTLLSPFIWCFIPSCDDLLLGQYICREPEINPNTSQPITCEPGNSMTLNCTIIPGLQCKSNNNTIYKDGWFLRKYKNGCTYSTDYHYHTALTLTVFFGWLGLDRFYLGYYAVGFIKLTTFGLFGILYLIDGILITLQILGPANGEQYFIPHFGPKSSYVGYDSNDDYSKVNCIGCFKGKNDHNEL